MTPSRAADAFGRVLVAMATPFDTDGALDLPGAQRLAAHLVDGGVEGLVVSGTTGESPTTTDEEKAALVRVVREAVGQRARVVAGVGTNDTAHTTALARQAEAAGADGLLVVTPYYSKPPQHGLVAHFHAAADATGLPVMVYDHPGRSATFIAEATLRLIAEHDRVVAVKDAVGDLVRGTRVMAATDVAYYSGDDSLNLAWLAHGATGVVSVVGHVAPSATAALVKAVDAGDLDTARRLYAALVPAEHGVMHRTQGAIAAKAALVMLGVLRSAAVRLPLAEMGDDALAGLRSDLEEAGLL